MDDTEDQGDLSDLGVAKNGAHKRIKSIKKIEEEQDEFTKNFNNL
jgi:hypothetical protein